MRTMRSVCCLSLLLLLAPAAAVGQEQSEEQSLSPEKRELIERHDELAQEFRKLVSEGKTDEAIAQLKRILEIERKAFGDVHSEVAGSLDLLAELHLQKDNFEAAEEARRESLQVKTKLYGEDDWRVTDARLAVEHLDRLNELTPEQRDQLEEAERLNQRVARLEERGQYVQAIPLAQQSLQIHRHILGAKHPNYATSLNNLGELYRAMGNHDGAELLFRQALQINKEVLSEKHPAYARSLNNLGLLYYSIGDYVQAEPLLRRAVAITKEVLGEEHAGYASTLNNLSRLYWAMCDYSQVEPLLRETLKINKQVFGEKHPAYATSLNNLAALYESMGDYAKAEPLYRQALEIDKEALGEKHPDYATSLNNLALLYSSMGDSAKAEPLFRQASAIRKEALGEKHPAYATSLRDLAGLYWSMGDDAQVEPLLAESLDISRSHLELTAAVQSERQQIWMAEKHRSTLDGYLSVADRAQVPDEKAWRYALDWKGAVFARRQQGLVNRDDPEVAELFDQLQTTSTQLATLTLSTPDPKQLEAWRRQIDKLSQQKEDLEAELSRKSAEFRRQQEVKQLTPSQLQQALPEETAVVDFLEYTHHSPPEDGDGEHEAERRLLAFVVRPDRDITRVDLGRVEPIRSDARAWRRAIVSGGGGLADPKAETQQLPQYRLRDRLWGPLQEHLQGVETVLVSPDGVVTRIPLAALPGREPGKYLLQEHRLAIVPVPRQLPLLLADDSSAAEVAPSMLLVGGVNFGAVPGGVRVAQNQDKQKRSLTRSAPRLGGLQLHSLSGARREVTAIKKMAREHLPQASLSLADGSEATEAHFRRQAPQHRYLHLATHGFFAPPQVKSALDRSESEDPRMQLQRGRREVTGFHPGLLSGIALAGANRGPPGNNPAAGRLGDDGILTALEVAALDLSEVELVVLSACETGLGEVAAGEGVLGLQRAFQSAGARSCVTSLWKVGDTATQLLMTEFYKNLWQKNLGRLEALRQAQLTMLKRYDPDSGQLRGFRVEESETSDRQGPLAPKHWAAFQLSGDWR